MRSRRRNESSPTSIKAPELSVNSTAKEGSPRSTLQESTPPPRTPRSAHTPRRAVGGKKGDATLLVNEDEAKKWNSFYVRTVYTLLMIAGFFAIVFIGRQMATALLVFFLQAMMYGETIRLMFKYQHEKELPRFRRLYYYWFFVCVIFVYGRILMEHFELHVFDKLLGMEMGEKGYILRHHTAISYALYVAGFITFVINLRKKKHYKYQFMQFAYCHIALLIIVVQSSFLVYNMFQGMIWFFLPCSLVICNDIFAYIWGFFFGRTRLIPQLSPKKTWEGFLGALFTTILFSFFFSRFMAQFELMICPQKGFLQSFHSCERDPLYIPRPLASYSFFKYIASSPAFLSKGLIHFGDSFTLSPIQLHALVLAVFASIVAPFGGFFASGFKRAFKIKDFGDSIPGHGGVTDRMDCQIVMGLTSYIYYTNFVNPPTIESEILRLLLQLSPQQQLEVYQHITNRLRESGALGR